MYARRPPNDGGPRALFDAPPANDVATMTAASRPNDGREAAFLLGDALTIEAHRAHSPRLEAGSVRLFEDGADASTARNVRRRGGRATLGPQRSLNTLFSDIAPAGATSENRIFSNIS